MNIFKIISLAVFAILTVLIGMVTYIYVITELHSDTFVGICAFIVSCVFMVMIYFTLRWMVVDAYPKIRHARKKPKIISPPPKDTPRSNSEALEKVISYTQNEMSKYARAEDMPTLLKIAEDFANKKKLPTALQVDRETSKLTPMDVLHFGRNLKTLADNNWSGPQVASFLKRAFPKILDTWAEKTITSKLTYDGGKFRVTLLSELK